MLVGILPLSYIISLHILFCYILMLMEFSMLLHMSLQHTPISFSTIPIIHYSQALVISVALLDSLF
jgi:hypothetical protein